MYIFIYVLCIHHFYYTEFIVYFQLFFNYFASKTAKILLSIPDKILKKIDEYSKSKKIKTILEIMKSQ